MRILHYFLGFPPYRSGGLTKFAFDLMKAQLLNNHEVYALWPGTIIRLGGKPYIRKMRKIEGIKNFELINPLPVALDEGIVDFSYYMKTCDRSIYYEFLIGLGPDVIHIHTLMGLHREFFYEARRLKIKLVMTSHDYYGLCPKVTLFRNGICCDDDDNCSMCIQCNSSALSMKKIVIMQSPIYRYFKDNIIVKRLRSKHRRHFYDGMNNICESCTNTDGVALRYQELRNYYIDIYKSIDFIHFNSTVAEKVYRRFFVPQDSQVVTITHQEINKRISIRKEKDKLQLYFLSPTKSYKGFNVIKNALDRLWKEGNRGFVLYVFDEVYEKSPYMIIKANGYKYEELPQIMANADFVLAPSTCYETFGFTVIEALSFGVPVIVSSNVGAKDIIGEAGIIFTAGDSNQLFDIISSLDNKQIELLQNEAQKINIKTWDTFNSEIIDIYTKQRKILC